MRVCKGLWEVSGRVGMCRDVSGRIVTCRDVSGHVGTCNGSRGSTNCFVRL